MTRMVEFSMAGDRLWELYLVWKSFELRCRLGSATEDLPCVEWGEEGKKVEAEVERSGRDLTWWENHEEPSIHSTPQLPESCDIDRKPLEVIIE